MQVRNEIKNMRNQELCERSFKNLAISDVKSVIFALVEN